MIEDVRNRLEQQEQTLVELEDELEMEISRVISLKNEINPDLIEDLEKIEEGLYVEVKMINETKKNVDAILKTIRENEEKDGKGTSVDGQVLEEKDAEIEKLKKRSEKLAKQLIQDNEEIEGMNEEMENELKRRENEIKNEVKNKLKEKDRNVTDKLLEAKKNEEILLKEIETLKNTESYDSDDVERVKTFFDKKIKNIKSTLVLELKEREKEIVEKTIAVYNKKKENVYNEMVKTALKMKNRTPRIDKMLKTLRDSLDLADDVYNIDNFSLCLNCHEVIHLSQSACPNCNAEVKY